MFLKTDALTKKSLFALLSLFIFLTGFLLVSAESFDEAESAFRSMVIVEQQDIVVPTVVELPVTNIELERKDFLVYEIDTERYIGNFLVEKQLTAPTSISVVSPIGNSHRLTDGSYLTSVDFQLPKEGSGEVEIVLSAASPIKSSALTLDLEKYVSLPTHIEVLAVDSLGSEMILVSKKPMTSKTVTFPQSSAKDWKVKLFFVQPLRINEITLRQDDLQKVNTYALRFLAQPGMSYKVLANPDRQVTPKKLETGNLSNDVGILKLEALVFSVNGEYQEADSDNDGVPDLTDNCVKNVNSDQLDTDGNGLGDVCEDYDRDGVLNYKDNCQNQPNRNQADEDSDEIGDACDDDESRLTEKYFWIPWVGIGFAGLVLSLLFVIIAMRNPKESRESEG